MAKEKYKSPAFQFYPKDYLTDTRVMMMDLATQGAYLRALFICWLEGGSITCEPKKLAMLIGNKCSVKIAAAVIELFTISEDGKTMRHKRLDYEKDKQLEYRTKQTANANARWQKNASQTDATAYPKPMPPHMPNESQTDALHLQSTSSNNNNNTVVDEKLKPYQMANHDSFLRTFFEDYDGKGHEQSRTQMIRTYGLKNKNTLRRVAEKFNEHLTNVGTKHFRLNEWQKHFNSWMMKLGTEMLIEKITETPKPIKKTGIIPLP